jgi:hypothetical protein
MRLPAGEWWWIGGLGFEMKILFDYYKTCNVHVHKCCPSSMNMACFVSARAIDLKLCTYVPLGHMTYQ